MTVTTRPALRTLASALGLAAAPVMAQTTVTPGASEGSSTDAFQGAIVDSSSPILPGFSADDAFGANTPNPTYEESTPGGHTIFDYGVTNAFINFHTLAPVILSGFDLFLSSDGVGNAFRGFSSVSLFASSDGGATFGTLLGGAEYDPASGGVTVSAQFAPTLGQYFRFEGVSRQPGARILEIDGTAAVPEPATWGMMLLGLGGMGYALRRRPAKARIRFA